MRAPKLKSIQACDYLDLTIVAGVFRSYGLLNHQDPDVFATILRFIDHHMRLLFMGTAIAMHWSNNAMSMQGSGDLIVSGGGWWAPHT